MFKKRYMTINNKILNINSNLIEKNYWQILENSFIRFIKIPTLQIIEENFFLKKKIITNIQLELNNQTDKYLINLLFNLIKKNIKKKYEDFTFKKKTIKINLE